MPSYATPNRHGYSVRFSPFNPDRFVVASSQFYGLAGGGTLFLLDLSPSSVHHSLIIERQTYLWSDGLFDCVWLGPDLVVSASGDGSLQLWNTDCSQANIVLSLLPQLIYREHKSEVYSVDFAPVLARLLSASWDGTVKLWDPLRANSLTTFIGHSQLVYSTSFSRFIPHVFASVGSDGAFKVWNSLAGVEPIASIQGHEAEVLSVDWSHKDENVLATCSSDGMIRIWDIRSFGVPTVELNSNSDFAVRKIQFSPHEGTKLASAGYDFTTRIWDYAKSKEALEVISHHSEFVYGIDWNRHRKNQLVDCGWDSLVHVFDSPKIEEFAFYAG